MRYSATLDQLVESTGIVIVPALLFGAVAAIVATGLAAVLSETNRLVRAVFIGLGTLLAVGAGWLILYAAGPDSYYEPGHYSRWEHAGRFLGTTPIVLAVVGAMATSVLLYASAFSPARRVLRLAAAPAAALSCVLLVFGWFDLTAGH